jgi:hypothetical protein
MKNKLLLTTAIAGLTAISGIANAETKVSGNLEQTFKAGSVDGGTSSGRALGAEYNIGLSNSTELNNGMKASFGFNLESNQNGTAADTGVTDSHYLTISGEMLSLSIARDNGQNLSSTVVPHISDQAGTVVDGASLENVGGVDAHNYDHIRLDAKVAGGTLTLRYAPDNGATQISQSEIVDTGTSQQEIIYSGSLGVDGLSVQAGISKEDADTSAYADQKFQKYGIAYNFGQIAIGVQMAKDEGGTLASKVEYNQDKIGATYAINDNLSVGINYQETEKKTAGVKSASDEETVMIGIGYNLGGVAIDVNYAEVDNLGNTTGTDAEFLQIRTIQKF